MTKQSSKRKSNLIPVFDGIIANHCGTNRIICNTVNKNSLFSLLSKVIGIISIANIPYSFWPVNTIPITKPTSNSFCPNTTKLFKPLGPAVGIYRRINLGIINTIDSNKGIVCKKLSYITIALCVRHHRFSLVTIKATNNNNTTTIVFFLCSINKVKMTLMQRGKRAKYHSNTLTL